MVFILKKKRRKQIKYVYIPRTMSKITQKYHHVVKPCKVHVYTWKFTGTINGSYNAH